MFIFDNSVKRLSGGTLNYTILTQDSVGEDLRVILEEGDGMFPVGRELVIRGDYRPAIIKDLHLSIPLVNHRLYGDYQTALHPRVRAPGNISYRGVFVDIKAHPVAAVILYDPVAPAPGEVMDGPGYLKEPVSGFGRGDPRIEAIPGYHVEPVSLRSDPACLYRHRLVADEAPQVYAAVQADQVSLGDLPPGGDAMDHLVVDGDADTPRKGVILGAIALEGRLPPGFPHPVPDPPV